MRIDKVKIVYLKEILDTFRDRRMILMIIIIPLFLFPTILIGMGFLMAKQLEKNRELIPKIVINNRECALDLVTQIENNKFNIVERESSETALKEELVQLVVNLSANFDIQLSKNEPTTLQILFNEADVKSINAKDKFIKVIDQYNRTFLVSKLVEMDINPQLSNIIQIETQNVASPEKMGSFILGIVLPGLIIILAFVGGTHTAIDITAGEKERGTLETLLVTPVSRIEIVIGKFLTVLTTSLLTALLGLISLLVTFHTGFSVLTALTETQMTISLVSVLIMFLMVFPIAWLFSSLLVIIGTIARNSKEAETYASFLLIIVAALGMVSTVPGFEADVQLFAVPIINLSLVQQELLRGIFNWSHIFLTLLTIVCFAIGSFYMSTKLFSREEVLFRV